MSTRKKRRLRSAGVGRRNQHPKDVSLNKWPEGWLKMEVAKLLGQPRYLYLSEEECSENNYPCNRKERIEFIRLERRIRK
jgi:hypothetical protein